MAVTKSWIANAMDAARQDSIEFPFGESGHASYSCVVLSLWQGPDGALHEWLDICPTHNPRAIRPDCSDNLATECLAAFRNGERVS